MHLMEYELCISNYLSLFIRKLNYKLDMETLMKNTLQIVNNKYILCRNKQKMYRMLLIELIYHLQT